MINTKEFYDLLIENKIDFYTGVPDSLLKDICAYITENTIPSKNIIAANEGNAVALASGYHLASGKLPLVYMQNSGIGNAINPLLSLADKEVYSIPMILLIGWRGQPNVKDEPQHVKQGKVTLELLDSMSIEYEILPEDVSEAKNVLKLVADKAMSKKEPVALIVKKGTFEKYKLKAKNNSNLSICREDAIKAVVDHLEELDVVVSTTGKTSRELFEYRDELGHNHKKDFLTVGSMGHANQIALGIALEKPERNVYCFDGDGAALMHTGGMGIIGDYAPENLKHIILNNGAHESVGGQPTIGFKVKFGEIAKGFGYKKIFQVSSLMELNDVMPKIKKEKGPVLLEILVSINSRDDLGRPNIPPIDNKNEFMSFLGQ